jgi:hypothetical protein
MIGCKLGIAVLEDTLAEDFSPNVALAKALFEFCGHEEDKNTDPKRSDDNGESLLSDIALISPSGM